MDSQLIWENYKNKLIVDHFDVMIERADRYVNGLLERISPEDIQQMKDADAAGGEHPDGHKRIRRRMYWALSRKYHPDQHMIEIPKRSKHAKPGETEEIGDRKKWKI